MPVPAWLRKRDHVLWDTADVIVKRVGEEAYAIRTDTREVIAHGKDHAEVIQKAIDYDDPVKIAVLGRLTNVGDIDMSYKKSVTIIGAGWSYDAEPDQVSGTVIELTGSIDARYLRRLVLKNIAFKGNNQQNDALIVGSDGRSNSWHIESVLFVGFNRAVYSDPSLTGLYDSLFINTYFGHNKVAIYIDENMLTFVRCMFRMNDDAMRFSRSWDVTILGSVFSGNLVAFHFEKNAGRVNVFGSWFEHGRSDVDYIDMFKGDTADAFTRGITIKSSFVSSNVRLDLSWLYPDHRKKVHLDDVWFQDLDDEDIPTVLPNLAEMAIDNVYRINTAGAVKAIRLENSGVATLASGSTSVTVQHGLYAKPSKVLITMLGQPPGKLWVENITDTSFDIVTDTAPSTDLKVAWYAEV